ncbi:MAG: hypothetical protein M1814_003149 [Vezdaea aestivalis]|nr:MAG: hypothetical protein M1814_003149 [Vezdaea aestivalis]
MPSANKPVLPPLKTPTTATFPSELARSPFTATPTFIKIEHDALKTPITPPVAYLDFLKFASPTHPSPGFWRASGKSTPTSQPSTSSSECSCKCENHRSPVSAVPPSPFPYPQSAPAIGPARRLRVPASPAVSPIERAPLSATTRSPLSLISPKDFEFTRPRYSEPRSATSRPVSVREVVTRTITYKQPRVNIEPAPKGKRRKLE